MEGFNAGQISAIKRFRKNKNREKLTTQGYRLKNKRKNLRNTRCILYIYVNKMR